MRGNGFTMIEVIVSTAILMSVIVMIVPIISILEKEQQILSDRRTIVHSLHDEMQPFLWNAILQTPSEHTKKINHLQVVFHFTNEDNYMKGCVTWQNVRKAKEKVCLYGIHAA